MKRAVVRSRPSVGLEHLVEEPPDVVALEQARARAGGSGFGLAASPVSLVLPPVSGATPYRPVYLSAVARPRYPGKGEPLPPPLPPASRTVGQVVAEAIKLYQAHFAWALALGLPVAVVDQVIASGSVVERVALLVAASPAFSLAYAAACAIRQGERPPLATWVVAVVVGVVTFLPAAFFRLVRDRGDPLARARGPRRAGRDGRAARRRRGRSGGPFELGRTDYVHAAGSFAALALLFGLTRPALGLLLQSQADATVRVAIFLADVVLSPLLFLGAAIVYVDLVARVGLSRDDRRQVAAGRAREARSRLWARTREEATGADLPDAHDADGEGQRRRSTRTPPGCAR